MRRKFNFSVLVAAAGAVAAGVVGMAGSRACASTIYNDTFARGSTGAPAALNGSTPAPTDTNHETWSVSPTSSPLTTNGTEAVFGAPSTNAPPYAAYLPVNLTGNPGTYTLSMTLIPTASTTDEDWLAIGFGNTVSGQQINSSDTEAWALYRENGQVQSFYGGATSNGVTSSASATPGTADTFTITIDSSTGAGSIADTGGLVSRTFTLSSTEMGNVNALVIGKFNTATGDAQNLTLTYVPEPATLGLMALGGLGILLVGRKHKRA